MRDYRNIDHYLNILDSDIYAQPLDVEHTKRCKDTVLKWCDAKLATVLDVGCGQGVAFPFFKSVNLEVTGVTLGVDFGVCVKEYPDVKVVEADMHFLPFESESFDIVFARHVLEHSPMPLLALMEWNRVARDRLIVVLPSAEKEVVGGKNHYYVLPKLQWKHLFKRAGWVIQEEDDGCDFEYRFYLRKKPYIDDGVV